MSLNSTMPLDRAISQALEFPGLDQGKDRADHRPGQPAPHLRAVEATPAAGRRRRPSALAGGLTAVFVVLGILAIQLGLSIVVSRGAYETRALEVEQRDLLRVERVLSQNLDKLASPQNLAENAAALGMVQNSTPATLRLSDGSISGDLTPRTTAVSGNLIANSTLTNLPVVDAEGLLVSRKPETPAAPATAQPVTPVPWEGKLPAPNTH